MEKTRQLMALSMVRRMGPRAFQNGLTAFGSVEGFFQNPAKNWLKVEGLRRLDPLELQNKEIWDKADKEIELAHLKKVNIITFFDKEYPPLLKEIHDPPFLLYVRGQIPGSSLAIGVVGSRRASRQGLELSESISQDLAGSGVLVVSGLARGIDSAAHRGALKTGKTAAVLGCGLSSIYPYENSALADEIVKNGGAVISEFPMSMKPLPQNFPMRNRIISGLSHGVLVVEAGQKSGALITVDFALEQGREVYALPGAANSEKTRGSNELLKQGARFVLDAQDILSDFNLKKKNNKISKESARVLLDKEEADLLRILKKEETLHLDELIEKSLLSPQKTMSLLTSLSIKGAVRELPGKFFEEVSK